MIFFPSGTYLVSKPIIPYYYTQLIGDAKNKPTLLASAGFTGMAVIGTHNYIPRVHTSLTVPYSDADPYIDGGGGAQWWVSKNYLVLYYAHFIDQFHRLTRTTCKHGACSGVCLPSLTVNSFKSIRNFVIDLRQMPATASATGLHWQVSQATSLTNVVVEMSDAADTAHQGIFMENGSGGFMGDLVFNGGKFGIWVGNQQFTVRNVEFNNAKVGFLAI